MRAIVVQQPWATLIALGVKWIETRPGPPNGPMRPDGVRGLPGCSLERGERIAIVAGVGTGTNYDRIVTHRGAWQRLAEAMSGRIVVESGAVVCTVTVEDAAESICAYDAPPSGRPYFTRIGSGLEFLRHTTFTQRITDRGPYVVQMRDQLALGDFTPGRWGWLLGDVQQTDPIPCKGRQGVFELPDEVAAAVAGAGAVTNRKRTK